LLNAVHPPDLPRTVYELCSSISFSYLLYSVCNEIATRNVSLPPNSPMGNLANS
jgi:hypothetical protein